VKETTILRKNVSIYWQEIIQQEAFAEVLIGLTPACRSRALRPYLGGTLARTTQIRRHPPREPRAASCLLHLSNQLVRHRDQGVRSDGPDQFWTLTVLCFRVS